MSGYRTAKGKVIDMDTLSTMNEKTRAVGNMGVNARGDVIDQNNKIVREGSKRINTNYQKTVSTAPVASNRDLIKPDASIDLSELTAAEREFEDFEDDEDLPK